MHKDPLKPQNDIVISQESVISLQKRVNIRKSAGPDALMFFVKLFQICAERGQIPIIWKTSTIIPKSKNAKELSDYGSVALISLIMKIFEKLTEDMVVSFIDGKLDPLQFAYQTGKCVDDAKLFNQDKVFRHLETPKSDARILFADFSLAFNKMQSHILITVLHRILNYLLSSYCCF